MFCTRSACQLLWGWKTTCNKRTNKIAPARYFSSSTFCSFVCIRVLYRISLSAVLSLLFPLFSLSYWMKRSEEDPGAAQGSHCECMVQYDVIISIYINMKHQQKMVKTYTSVETKHTGKRRNREETKDTLLTGLTVQWVLENKSTTYFGSLCHSWNWKQNLEIAFPWQHTKNWLLLQAFKVLGSLVV